jgi:hypothetical protein
MELGEVKFGAVAFVLAEAILRKAGAEVTHHHVAGHFRDHAGGRDTQADGITINDSGLWERKRNHRQAINQDVVRGMSQRDHGGPHGHVRRPQNIDSINFEMIDHPDRPGNFHVPDQFVINFFPQLRNELLGILQFAVAKFLRQNDGRSHHRAGQSAAAGFINAGDPGDTDGAQFLFIAKTAAPIHCTADYPDAAD